MFRNPRTTQERRESQSDGDIKQDAYTTHFHLCGDWDAPDREADVRVRYARTLHGLPTAWDDIIVGRNADRSWKNRTKNRRKYRVKDIA